ncbi:MAG TPA: LuxR C-terminal-related transcriptional regulator [Candidatus Krumholzibacteria bacterium]|nr:LuxR C-terminal-related transcriptional regulator [Candidatus Krumholzibacteria bacterium]
MLEPPGRTAPNLPAWVSRLGMPVWISAPDGTLSYMNRQAEVLIGQSAADCVGNLCYLVIAGRTPDGTPLCCPRCRVRRLADEREEIEPVRIAVPVADGTRRDATVVIIGLEDGQLVHCVVDAGNELRLRHFLDHVTLRTPDADSNAVRVRLGDLTMREREVLELLAEDATLHDIANRLGVSYATVRNHVQHILGKLGVHSILEAVAVLLLGQD